MKNKKERFISIDCYYYLIWLFNKKGFQIDILKSIKHNSEDVHSYFQRKYTACIVDELVDIFCLTEESINLQKAGVSEDDTEFIHNRIEGEFDILKQIYYEADTFYSAYKSGNPISIDMISFVAKMNVVPAGPRGTGIYDVIHYLELHRRMNPLLLKNIIIEYENKLREAVKQNNVYVISFLKNTYLAIADLGDDSYNEVFTRVLGEVPFVLDDISIHKDENTIMKALSDKGKFAYKAALMQFSYSLEHDYGALDAGMLCLSYMRILELEVSQKIVLPLTDHILEIETAYYDGFNTFTDEEKKANYIDKWYSLVFDLKKVASKELDGLMMGAINKLFENMKVKKYKDKSSENMRACIDMYLSGILSDKGNNSIGDLQRIFSSKNRDKYRNPPAHTRFVGINTALECRSFVEANLLFINECVR